MDSIFTSLLRGRMMAAVASLAVAGVSTSAALTDAANEATALTTALLALISALAAIVSKIRELRRSFSVEDAVRTVIDEHRSG
jgi:hypothetical protein